MSEYSICTNFAEIIAGTNNTIARSFTEATKSLESDPKKGLNYLKNFITSIENIDGKEGVKDSRISSTKGNITKFSGYDNIKTAIEFLNKNLSGIEVMKDLVTIFNALENNQTQYTEGYNKNIRLIVLEYESAVYLLVTGLSMVMATNIDVVQNGVQIRIQKKSGSTYGIIPKTAHDLAKQIGSKDHKVYLEELISEKSSGSVPEKKATSTDDAKTESVLFMEATIENTIDLIDAMIYSAKRIVGTGKRLVVGLKNSVFGIVPLIRSIMYLRYKKKADTVLALDQQCEFIRKNIEQLQNIKTMDPAKKEQIIKKQQAVCEAYKKKAEKLRAELTEGEKDAAISIKKEDPEMKKDNGDFVLEGASITQIFGE
jgi:hypothetical protein